MPIPSNDPIADRLRNLDAPVEQQPLAPVTAAPPRPPAALGRAPTRGETREPGLGGFLQHLFGG